MTTRKAWIQTAWQLPAIVLVALAAAMSIHFINPEAIVLFGDFAVERRLAKSGKALSNIDVSDAAALFKSGRATFYDARSPDDYAAGHIKGARSLPAQMIESRFIGAVEGIGLDDPIIVYCDGEACELSHKLGLFLSDMGFVDVRILLNGWTVWKDSDLPIETTDSGATG